MRVYTRLLRSQRPPGFELEASEGTMFRMWTLCETVAQQESDTECLFRPGVCKCIEFVQDET